MTKSLVVARPERPTGARSRPAGRSHRRPPEQAGEIGPVRREIIFEPVHEQPAPAEPAPVEPAPAPDPPPREPEPSRP
jgi:hypothetical protein